MSATPMRARLCALLLGCCAGAVSAQERRAPQEAPTAESATQTDASAPAAGAEPAAESASAPAAPDAAVAEPALNAPEGYTPPAQSQPALRITGYVDVGLARVQGDGTSFAPGDTRLPADYGSDPFQTAVNSRGDVASIDSGGRFTNGFLPHSLGIGGRTSFFLSTVDADVRYQPAALPVFLFTRLQVLPRFSAKGDATRVLVEQAFARLSPLASQELALSVGKFDSVFGIEYLENEANIRTNVTPSLVARYTTGQSLGAKLFYRYQVPALWMALSLNFAATNSGTMIDALAPPETSLTGTPVFSGRAGLEFNLPRVELKLGASGMSGPRNDQSQPGVRQKAVGGDARFLCGPLELRGEIVRLLQDEGGEGKLNGNGPQTSVSGFAVTGGYGQVALGKDFDSPLRRATIYGRYEKRHALFQGFTPLTVDRVTAGLRLDLLDALVLKGELLVNRELDGAPDVDNNVLTSSLVYVW